MTDEPNHPIDEPAGALEGGTVLPPAGEAPLPPAVPAETAAPPPAPAAAVPAETASPVAQAGVAAGANESQPSAPEKAAADTGLAAGANVPEAAAPDQHAVPQAIVPQPAAPQAAEGTSPGADEAPEPPAPAVTPVESGNGTLPSAPPPAGTLPSAPPPAGTLPSAPPPAGTLPSAPPPAGTLPSAPPPAGTLPSAPPPAKEAATAEIPADKLEVESLVALRRTPAKPAKSGGKKAKAAAKPAAAKPAAAKPAVEPAAEPAVPAPKSENMNWFILKVQSNREDSIREGLLRRVAIAGLDYFFGEVIVPTEKVTEVKQGRKRVTKRKLYPGYLVVQMEINDDTWFLVRETPGIGDFTGAAGAPTPMLPHEVNRILQRSEEKTDQAPKLDIRVHAGDRVKINEGTFENFEGEVDNIDATNGRVTVMINIFGRSTPVELEYWQIEGL